MRSTRFASACAGASFFIALTATGASASTLSSADLFSSGDGLLTRDSMTSLEWLDLTATTGLSCSDVLADVGGWISLNFRLATRAEVDSLWIDLGFPVTTGSFDHANDPFYASFVALLGETKPSDGTIEGTIGFSADSPGPGGAYLPQVLHDLQSDGSGTATILNNGNNETFSDATVGSWLVRAYTLPEPMTLGLFGLGLSLAAIGIAARRSASRRT